MIEIIVAVVGVIGSIAASYFLGGRNAKSKSDAEQAKSELTTYKDSRHAQDEMGSADDDYIDEWLRKRAKK